MSMKNFEELYRKAEEGKATQEELAQIAEEIVTARKVNKILQEEEADLFSEAEASEAAGAKAASEKIEDLAEEEAPKKRLKKEKGAKKGPTIEPASEESMKRLLRRHRIIQVIIGVVTVLVVLAVVWGGRTFMVMENASKNTNVSREQAIEIAKDLVIEEHGASSSSIVVTDVESHLNTGDGMNHATRIYEIDLRDGTNEYEIRVNGRTGETHLTDMDWDDHDFDHDFD